MGNKKELQSRPRLSRKKIFADKRKKKKEMKRILEENKQTLKKENIEIFNDTGDESISLKLTELPNSIEMTIKTEDTQCWKPVPIKESTNVLNCENDNTPVIDSTRLDKNCVKVHEPSRSIVDMSFFMKELHRTFDDHNKQGLKCLFKNWIFIKSCRHGFLTQFFFKCQICNHEANIWSEPIKRNKLNINTAAVGATIAAGIDYHTLEEICSGMDIPCISELTYYKCYDLYKKYN